MKKSSNNKKRKIIAGLEGYLSDEE